LSKSPVIAVVDDDAAMREALFELLQVLDLPCRTFDGAEAFLAAYAPGSFDCLITDIRMPSTTGLELQQKLNSLGSTTPVIVESLKASSPRK
jgi:two-component system, LuxR family, response regulator FixJ